MLARITRRQSTLTSTSSSLFSVFGFSALSPVLLVLSFLIASANAFTFRFTSTPAQCEPVEVVWTTGTPPYKILLLPIGFQPQGVETRVIYEKTVTTGTQTAFNFPFPANSKFVAVMSDGAGFGSGGTSPILTVHSSNTSSCIPTSPSTPEFYFYLSSTTLSQCQSVHISWENASNPPVTVYGVIPQGESFDLNAASRANGGTGFDWSVNIPSGTPFFFVSGDANGSGKGGSTDVQNIGGGSSGCLGSDPPTTTSDGSVGSVGSLPSTGTGTATVTQTAGASNGNGSNGSGSGNGNNDGNGNGNTGGDNGNNDGNGNGNGNGSGNGNGNGGGNPDPGSGGGTVHGPEPTTIATCVGVLILVSLLV